ncbi:unnamed protein product [Arctia plantaginis]|uniref:Uncharacterized protein n=1 Tax=Arctia plantaginis TaxID=874455 RepID=A0A8S0ZVJ6_ARCPL|nr:unnamed protein product [Arctia plantaginis]
MMENAERDNIDTAICHVIKGRTILYLAKSLARGGMRASNSTRSKTLEIECALALDLSEMGRNAHPAAIKRRRVVPTEEETRIRLRSNAVESYRPKRKRASGCDQTPRAATNKEETSQHLHQPEQSASGQSPPESSSATTPHLSYVELHVEASDTNITEANDDLWHDIDKEILATVPLNSAAEAIKTATSKKT